MVKRSRNKIRPIKDILDEIIQEYADASESGGDAATAADKIKDILNNEWCKCDGYQNFSNRILKYYSISVNEPDIREQIHTILNQLQTGDIIANLAFGPHEECPYKHSCYRKSEPHKLAAHNTGEHWTTLIIQQIELVKNPPLFVMGSAPDKIQTRRRPRGGRRKHRKTRRSHFKKSRKQTRKSRRPSSRKSRRCRK